MTRLRPPFKSVGGKWYLAPALRGYTPVGCKTWVENFARGFSLTLAEENPATEVWNDLDWRLYFLMLTIQKRSATLVELLKAVPYEPETFYAARRRDLDSIPGSRDPMYVAVDTFIKLNMSRGGGGEEFAWSDRYRGGQPGDVNAWETRIEMLPKIAYRISEVVLHCGCGIELARNYASDSKAFQYFDPPYFPETRTSPKVYGEYEMSRQQHGELAVVANDCKGPVMISGYSCSEYDSWYSGPKWRQVDFNIANHSGQGTTKQRRIESIWMNY